MGAVNSILLTGAAGFLGQEILAAALQRGLKVQALVRDAAGRDLLVARFGDNPDLTVLQADLCDGLPADVGAFQAVIHAAARMKGDDADHARDTIAASAALLRDLKRLKVFKLVLISSMAVYDFQTPKPYDRLEESALLETQPEFRDAYCRAKLQQEALCQDFARANGDLTPLRPGLLFDENNVATDHLGQRIGAWFIAFGHRGQIPLLHVRNCASAAVHFAAIPSKNGGVFNLVDDDLPDLQQAIRFVGIKPALLVPWWFLGLVGAVLRPFRRFLPGLARGPVIAARAKPFAYSNELAKQAGWVPVKSGFGVAKRQALQEPGRRKTPLAGGVGR